ncbi:flavin reductase [Rhodococcus sp. WS4]|nr:flavin reductase [Rhodococcus sp. WS4]
MPEVSTIAPVKPVEFGDNATALRQTFALFPSGVAALSAIVEGEPVVLVASSFQVGISLDPPLVLFSVAHTSTSWPKLKTQDRIGVSVLGESHDAAAKQLASKAADRFADIETITLESGAHFIHRAHVRLECSIYSEVPAGDHDVVLLEVHAMDTTPDTEPLIWHRSGFRSLTPKAIA